MLPADRRKQLSPRECYVRTRREVGSTTIVRKRLNSDRRGEEAATQGGEQGSSVHPGELPNGARGLRFHLRLPPALALAVLQQGVDAGRLAERRGSSLKEKVSEAVCVLVARHEEHGRFGRPLSDREKLPLSSALRLLAEIPRPFADACVSRLQRA